MVWPTSWEDVPISGNVMSDCEQWSIGTHKADKRLLQLRVLRFGLFQDGDVGVGVFPECDEILVGRE
jgi:hypothetical protein